MKRKFADRPNWKRVLTRTMITENFDSEEFRGCAVLIHIQKVRDPLWVELGGQKQCVVDDGYSWLTLFQKDVSYVVTAMFNRQGQVVQWYIDICKAIGMTDKGIPWYDDLYLDIVISSEYDISLIDEDDLELALRQRVIKQEDFDFAYAEAEKLLEQLRQNKFDLLSKSKSIYNYMMRKIDNEKQQRTVQYNEKL